MKRRPRWPGRGKMKHINEDKIHTAIDYVNLGLCSNEITVICYLLIAIYDKLCELCEKEASHD